MDDKSNLVSSCCCSVVLSVMLTFLVGALRHGQWSPLHSKLQWTLFWHILHLHYFCFCVCDWTTRASHHSTSLVVLHLITFLKLLTSTCHFGVALSSRLAIAIWPFVRVAWTLTHTHFLLSPTQTWNPVCLLAAYYIPSLKSIIVTGSVLLISRLYMWCHWRLSHLDWKIQSAKGQGWAWHVGIYLETSEAKKRVWRAENGRKPLYLSQYCQIVKCTVAPDTVSAFI